MANAKRDFIVEKVKEVLAAPSCCPELKDAAQKYLAALDTADEKAAGKILIAELEEDVQSYAGVFLFRCGQRDFWRGDSGEHGGNREKS